VGVNTLFRAHPTRLEPYANIETVVARATGADRPQRRIEKTVEACEARVIAPYLVQKGEPVLTAAIPTLVPEYYYGWGAIVYQSTLDVPGGP
jgi:hypothetical protein